MLLFNAVTMWRISVTGQFFERKNVRNCTRTNAQEKERNYKKEWGNTRIRKFSYKRFLKNENMKFIMRISMCFLSEQ